MKDVNPLEELVEELSDVYVELVYEIAEELAPVRPWWTADLSADAQLWRWIGSDEEPGPRAVVLPWLMAAAAHMGATTPDEALAMIEDIFTSPAATDLIPADIVADIPIELLEIVQASGPKDAAKHIRKMEKMVAGRLEAVALLQNTDQPNVPEVPPPLPVEMAGFRGGWPEYGGVGREDTPPAFSLPV